jgi:hypothetical protein
MSTARQAKADAALPGGEPPVPAAPPPDLDTAGGELSVPAASPQNADAAAAVSEPPASPPPGNADAWQRRIPGAVFYCGFPPGS